MTILDEKYDMYQHSDTIKKQENRYSAMQIYKAHRAKSDRRYKLMTELIGDSDKLFSIE